MNPIEIIPVGRVENSIDSPIDDIWGKVVSRIVLDPSRFTAEALAGLAEFSHVEVVFVFHKVEADAVVTGARRPRGRSDLPITGIFAQRAKNRPNRIGITTCRLLAVDDLTIEVEGLDAINGSPVLDLRPYMREFAPRGDVRQPAWVSEVMANYWAG